MDDPLPIEALQFGNVVHELCKEACIAGSAPLAKYFHNIKETQGLSGHEPRITNILNKISSNDADVFAPMCPSSLARMRALPTFDTLSNHQKAWHVREPPSPYPFELVNCKKLLRKRYGLKVCRIKERSFNLVGLSCDDYNIWNEAINLGIRRIYNFKLKHIGNKKPCKVEMQLILLDGIPRQNQPWEDFITTSFDIDIVKGVATIDDISNLGKLTFEPCLLQKIRQGMFSYKIRNCIDLNTLISRIKKYLARGFFLADLEFDNDCCKLYRLHAQRKLQCHISSTMCYKWFDDNCLPLGVVTDLLPTIKGFLEEPTYAKRIFRAMQLEQMRLKLERNGWWTSSVTLIHKCELETIVLREHATRCAVLRIERWFLAQKKRISTQDNNKKRSSMDRVDFLLPPAKRLNAAR